MGKTQKRAAKRAANAAKAATDTTQAGVVKDPSATKAETTVKKKLSVAERSAAITTALQEKRCKEALEQFREFRALGMLPRLGSLQRWVRLVDNCFLSMDPERLQVMHALLYVCDPCRTARLLDALDLPIRVRYCQPELPGVVASSEAAADQTVKSAEEYVAASRVCFDRSGGDRIPPNKHPLKIIAMDDDAFPNDSKLLTPVVAAVAGLSTTVVGNALSARECAALIACGEALEYAPDEPLTGSEAVPSNAFVWMCPPQLRARLFERIRPGLPMVKAGHGIPCQDPEEVLKPLGLNARFRSYRYETGFVYRPHFDGAWPSSGFDAEGGYVYDAHSDRRSRITVLFYLNDDFTGGQTTFFALDDEGEPGGILGRRVKPVRGAVALFPHGDVFHVIHEGSSVDQGRKYVIRTEVLYSLPKPAQREGSGQEKTAEKLPINGPPKKKRRR
eukprot:TRINITY_DN35897_c0_g1_i1.p1 TRINITY_DN35897_c0_g1~~TRINITY_DN35897_c0_g1_i1.p1  ORF type:complete len:472 (-),score=89.45 TRINITY_DN35897_c0_g1_i1:56-1396(-)